ncbi:hypothetical protein MRB53_028580 [Persea americana]|uniref:Uncharacterized protein n=1 Tax=Persea americana TaxID=3435 RepID=A0ACC2KG03_PERAE|nr:hypothetical protein MRB53_028580 [Persea americana]
MEMVMMQRVVAAELGENGCGDGGCDDEGGVLANNGRWLQAMDCWVLAADGCKDDGRRGDLGRWRLGGEGVYVARLGWAQVGTRVVWERLFMEEGLGSVV